MANFDVVSHLSGDQFYFTSWAHDQGYCFQKDVRFDRSKLHRLDQFSGDVYDFRDYGGPYIILNEDLVIWLDPKTQTGSIFARTPKDLKRVIDAGCFISVETTDVNVSYFYFQQDSVYEGIVSWKLKNDILPDLYPDYDIIRLTDEFIESPSNILILYGQPGTGKTSFLRYMLATGRFNETAYAKDQTLMVRGAFWARLVESNFSLIVLDDLDRAIEPRAEHDNEFLTNLLSYSDGIFESRSKIVITTNQPVSRIDEALTRPGRCFDFLVLEPLSKDEAFRLWIEVLDAPPEAFPFKHSIVTQAALMDEYMRWSQGRQTRSYVKNGKDNYTIQDKLERHGIVLK